MADDLNHSLSRPLFHAAHARIRALDPEADLDVIWDFVLSGDALSWWRFREMPPKAETILRALVESER